MTIGSSNRVDFKNKYKAVLFDFDYTLADSSKGVAECINHALVELNYEAVSYEAACKTIGFSLNDIFEKLTGKAEEDHKASFTKLFISKADEVMVASTFMFEGVAETLHHLKSKGIKLGVVSTKYRHRIEDILEANNLSGIFDIIVGGEDVKNHKPHPDPLFKAIDSLGVAISDVLYIGDSLPDAEAAHRAGIDFMAVLSGTTEEKAFSDFTNCGIIAKLSEVKDVYFV